MGHWDDLMDIEDFLKKNRAPNCIKEAWRNHMELYNEFEKSHDELCELQRALGVIKDSLKKI